MALKEHGPEIASFAGRESFLGKDRDLLLSHVVRLRKHAGELENAADTQKESKLKRALARLTAADSERADCPGKIICPETGKLICRDKCPTIDQNRPDCPGRVVCPLTGKLVCKDRCPVGDAATKNTDAKVRPACCRKGT